MKKAITLFLVLILAFSSLVTASAWSGTNYWIGSVGGFESDVEYAAQDSNEFNYLLDFAPDGPFAGFSTATWGGTSPPEFAGKSYVSWPVTDAGTGTRTRNLTARIRLSKGANLIDSYKIVGIKDRGSPQREFAAFQIILHEKVRSADTDGMDIDFTAVIQQGGRDIASFTGSINYGNAYVNVFGNDEYVNAEKGLIVVAREYNNKLEVDLGDGISLNTSVHKGRNYWAWAESGANEEDASVLKSYPFIQETMILDWLGYNEMMSTVKLNGFGNAFWVYTLNDEGDLVYLERSDKELPLHKKYFLSSRELDIGFEPDYPDFDFPGSEEKYDDPEINPSTGGDDVHPSNFNDNPGTGR